MSVHYHAGTQELNLRELPLELTDVAAILDGLPNLRVFHLSGVKKLPPKAVSALFIDRALKQQQTGGNQGRFCDHVALFGCVC